MIKYSSGEIQKMKQYVINNLIDKYNYSFSEAEKMVEQSVFNQLLKEDTDYVFHYSVEYWAKEIYNEYTELCIM